jgi:hypothetical protein
MSFSLVFQNITYLVVIIVIGYIFGFLLLQMIDKKMNQMYTEQQIQQKEMFENKTPKREEVIVYHKIDAKETDDKMEFTDITEKVIEDRIKHKKFKFDEEYYQNMNMNQSIEGFTSFREPKSSQIDWSPSSSNVQEKVCFKNHHHHKDGSSKDCTYGVTNYADPRDMSPVDYQIFFLNYPPNMTLQDYINWLWCYRDKKEQLTYNHLRNLEKLEFGKPLISQPGICPPPSYYQPPLNAEDYFNKMYNQSNEFDISAPLHSVTGPMVGYNYKDYSEFSQNQDVYGQSGELRNPDIGLKKTAKEVDNYILPKDSQNLEEENKYHIYHVKNVEL